VIGRLGQMARQAISAYTMRTGRGHTAYRLICQPRGREYAEYLRRHGGFYAMGEDCYISPHAVITDPDYVSIGNNVRISNCHIFGHDGSVNMINRAFGLNLDNVGKVEIRDNVFLAHACIIQPGVTIGPNAIVAAGSVVNRDVEPGMIAAGVPAKPVGTVAMYAELLRARNQQYPWRHLIEQRRSEFDPALEPELRRVRIEYFYASAPRPSKQTGDA
jgi:acetyltransferase-like isoleucine patch superfamily enzyme